MQCLGVCVQCQTIRLNQWRF